MEFRFGFKISLMVKFMKLNNIMEQINTKERERNSNLMMMKSLLKHL